MYRWKNVNKNFRHYDLHFRNVLVNKKINKKYNFFMSKKKYKFKGPLIKIIDYGLASYFKTYFRDIYYNTRFFIKYYTGIRNDLSHLQNFNFICDIDILFILNIINYVFDYKNLSDEDKIKKKLTKLNKNIKRYDFKKIFIFIININE